ncbi:MAG: hypothetical protein GY713_15145 [Actinomycetia bacterium]|nr:hypothetical protein [Actinomycetes bacterium]
MTSRRALAWTALFIALPLLVNHPSWSEFSGSVPSNLGDPALVIWILEWDWHALTTDPGGLFDAPVFWPAENTLAYTENLLPLAPIYGTFSAVTGNWTLSLNLLLLTLSSISLAGTWLLVHWLSGRRDLALLAAVIYTFSSYSLGQTGHPQLQALGFVPLGFWALFRVIDEPTVRRGFGLGLATLTVTFSALYYGLVFGLSVTLVVAAALIRQRGRFTRDQFLALATAGATVVGVAVPLMLPYLELRDAGIGARGYEPQNSLFPLDLITPARGNWLYGTSLDGINSLGRPGAHAVFPGFLALLLGIVGLVLVLVSWRRDRTGSGPVLPTDWHDRRGHLVDMIVCGLVVGLLSAGPGSSDIPLPFRVFHRFVPGFDGVRVTSRFVVIPLLVGAVLAAVGLHWLLTRREWTRSWIPTALVVGATAAHLGEMIGTPYYEPLRADPTTLAVYEELNRRPPGVVLELPVLGDGFVVPWGYTEAPRLVYATTDWNTRFNGYSGDVPAGYFETAAVLAHFPAPEAVDLAESIGVRYVLVHTVPHNQGIGYDPAQVDQILASLPEWLTAEPHGTSYLIDLEGGQTPYSE